ncbi:MAG: hypothetical protein VX438_07160, partial [Planctomycetota bacterium]|nr:hypothetical protein [Planctomycetota bacterium]
SEPALDLENLKTDLIQQIGYQVISRKTVILVLSVYTLVLVSTGIWLGIRQKLERLFFIGPALALLTAFTFFGIGLSNQKSAPATVASFQFIQTIEGGNELQVDGMSVLYSQENQDFELGATNDAELKPLRNNPSGELEKTAWQIDGTWNFAGNKIEPGLEAYRFTSNVPTEKSIVAPAVFGTTGLVGAINNSFSTSDLEDSILALPSGKNLTVRLNEQKFQLSDDQQLPPGQFIQSNLLTDKQRWRQSIYQDQFPEDQWEDWVKTPTLFAWSDPIATDIRYPENFRRVGGALIRIPVILKKSPPGSQVTIPAAFVGVTNVLNSRNAISPSFNSKSKQWIGSISKETTTRIRFQLPREVLPLKLESATLSIQSIKALDRILEIKSGRKTRTNIEKLDNFVGNLESKITDPEILVLDQQGGLLIDIDIAVKPEFYARRKEIQESGELGPDGKKKKLELAREELVGIALTATGTVAAQND